MHPMPPDNKLLPVEGAPESSRHTEPADQAAKQREADEKRAAEWPKVLYHESSRPGHLVSRVVNSEEEAASVGEGWSDGVDFETAPAYAPKTDEDALGTVYIATPPVEVNPPRAGNSPAPGPVPFDVPAAVPTGSAPSARRDAPVDRKHKK